MKKKTTSATAKPSGNRKIKDLQARETETIKGGTSVSNVLKTRHDTAKNSISNVR